MSSLTRDKTPPRRPPTIREQCDHCRHFTGIGSNADGSRRTLGTGRGECRVNVKYDDVMKQGARMIALPCFHPEPDNMPADGVWPTCTKLSFKTAAEIEAENAELEQMVAESMQRLTVVIPAILKASGGKRGTSGKMDCPVCKTGTMHWSVSGYNGHKHARCTTEGCVSFME